MFKLLVLIACAALASAPALADNADNADAPPRIDPNFVHQPWVYGDGAYKAHELGRCVVRAKVSADGKTLDTQIETSSGYTGYVHLDWSCMYWVTKFHWIPGTHNGHVVEASTNVTINWIDSGRGSAIAIVDGVPMKVVESQKPFVAPPPPVVRVPSTSTILAQPTDRRVRIAARAVGRIDGPQPQLVTGDVIPASSLLTIIFLESPCTLEIDGAQDMHRAWQLAGAYQLGCWYPARGGGWQFMGQISRMDYNHTDPWEAMPRALLHADGTTTITEPNYDSRTFAREWYDRRNAHLFDHVDDKP